MKAISCPKCGAPLQAGLQSCPYCRVGLVNDEPGSAPASSAEAPVRADPLPVKVPEGWVCFQDVWHGFSLAHPPGWHVETLQGQVSIREDPLGIVAATIWPYSLPYPASAHQAAAQLAALAREVNPTFQVWQQENAAPDSNRITLRTHQVRSGQAVEGCFNVLVDGTSAIISGYEAPASVIAQRSPVLSTILSTFRTCELMPRQKIREPMEGAFSGTIPAGWIHQAGVNRNNSGGTALAYLSVARDPQGMVSAVMPWHTWTFTDPGYGMGAFGGMFAGMSSYPTMPFVSATVFCQTPLAQWMGQAQANFRIESIVDRPDLTEIAYQELAQAGYPREMYEASRAVIESTYTENGVRLRQKSRVGTQRQRANAMAGGAPLWSAYLDTQYRAPDNEFATWEPVLKGILDAIQMNQSWKAAERARIQGVIASTQQDIMRRTRQISQTLSETSDIITNSYWNRQAVYDHIAEIRSDAIRGVHPEVNPTGDVFKLPNGFDRYWTDGLGNFYGGSWFTQPDIHWIPLEPGKQ